jgi:hypothetical protein
LADVALTGTVYGGQQPLVGAHVYLFAANTTGYGGAGIAGSSSNASVSLISASETGTSDSVGAYVATGSNGAFSLTGDYSCSSGQQLYMYVLGGTNAAAGLMAAIGSCPASGSPAIAVTVNEVTTIAAAYALAGFATDATHISSSGTALAKVGIANAFSNAANLANVSTGMVLATSQGGDVFVPVSTVNTLANILAACVSSAGAVSGPVSPTSCYTLFYNALPNGSAGTPPTETATAAINVAHHPAASVAALYSLAAATAPFVPALTSQPYDLTVGLTLGGDLYIPTGVAIDGSDNAWVVEPDSVIEYSGSGAILSGTSSYTGGGLNYPEGVAIDGSGNVWVTNELGNSVTKLSSVGAILSGADGYMGGGLNYPEGIAIDGSGKAWAANYLGNTVTELSGSGTFFSGAGGYAGGGLNYPEGIAIDGSGNAWIANPDGNSVTKLSSVGAILSGANGYTGAGLNYPYGIAIDGSGNVWVTNELGNSVTELGNTGTILSGASGYTGGGLGVPAGIAIDGSGNAWVANYLGSDVTELSSSGAILSGAFGYTGGGIHKPTGIAIDGSGDVWVTDTGYSSVTELVGVATPVITPIAAGLPSAPTANGSSTLGTRP